MEQRHKNSIEVLIENLENHVRLEYIEELRMTYELFTKSRLEIPVDEKSRSIIKRKLMRLLDSIPIEKQRQQLT